MSSSNATTLSGIFSPPDGMFGQMGLACAYSAGQEFMEQVLSSFTGRGPKARKLEGRADFFLMTDPSTPNINGRQVPGLVCLMPKGKELWKTKVAIQHAKVALLRFGTSRTGPAQIFRLIVSTGNWTGESASNNIEMIWSVDLTLSEIDTMPEGKQIARDMTEAAAFLKDLSTLYTIDSRLRDKADAFLNDVLNTEPSGQKMKSRFFSTLPRPNTTKKPGLSQEKGRSIADNVLERFCDNAGRRNLIQGGSGFFENAVEGREVKTPATIDRIEDMLINDPGNKRMTGLIQYPYKVLTVNPSLCGQVAKWVSNDDDIDWEIHKPADPSGGSRSTLHAKYLLIGQYQNRSNGRVDRGKIYIGSGNLSLMGFFSAFGLPPSLKHHSDTGPGNIEAGVVFDLPWEHARDEKTLHRSLAVGDELEDRDDALEAGEPEETSQSEFIEPIPLTCFEIENHSAGQDTMTLKPVWSEELLDAALQQKTQQVELLLSGNRKVRLKIGEDKHFQISDSAPDWICARWQNHTWEIPVLTSDGNFVPQRIALSGMDELFSLLKGFPNLTIDEAYIDDDDPETEPEDGEDPGNEHHDTPPASVPPKISRPSFPLSSSMQFVEKIADMNQQLPMPEQSGESGSSPYLQDWIFQLGNLLNCLPDWQIKEWQQLETNFLDALKQKYFAPPGICDEWHRFIDRLAHQWGLDRFESICRTDVGEER